MRIILLIIPCLILALYLVTQTESPKFKNSWLYKQFKEIKIM